MKFKIVKQSIGSLICAVSVQVSLPALAQQNAETSEIPKYPLYSGEWVSDQPPTDLRWPKKAFYCQAEEKYLSNRDFVAKLLASVMKLDDIPPEFQVDLESEYWTDTVFLLDYGEVPRIAASVKRYDHAFAEKRLWQIFGFSPGISVKIQVRSVSGDGRSLSITDAVNECGLRAFEFPVRFRSVKE